MASVPVVVTRTPDKGMSDMSDTKTFSLGAVLSVTTGRLLADIGECYEILGWMTGESLFTHQLPRAGEECLGPLLEQHPDLRCVVVPEFDTPDEYMTWLHDVAVPEYGATREVAPLAAGVRSYVDPLTELDGMLRPDQQVIMARIAPTSGE